MLFLKLYFGKIFIYYIKLKHIFASTTRAYIGPESAYIQPNSKFNIYIVIFVVSEGVWYTFV